MFCSSGTHERPLDDQGIAVGPNCNTTALSRLCFELGFAMRGAWTVLASRENAEADRCIDIFVRGDGTFGFEEYRRDPEDAGGDGAEAAAAGMVARMAR
jgi:hypothetical protein